MTVDEHILAGHWSREVWTAATSDEKKESAYNTNSIFQLPSRQRVFCLDHVSCQVSIYSIRTHSGGIVPTFIQMQALTTLFSDHWTFSWIRDDSPSFLSILWRSLIMGGTLRLYGRRERFEADAADKYPGRQAE